MAKIRSKNKVDPEIPTGSFADIAFLLLVFFMLTTVISITRGIWFKVPEQIPPEDKPDKPEPAIYIHVNEAGTLMVDKKPMALGEIKKYCKDKLIVNQNKPVIIHCSGNQQYQKMIEVLDQVKQAIDTDPESYYKDADYYMPVCQRLSAFGNIKSLEKLSCKVNHLRFRASLPRRKYAHIPLVIRELLALKYHRFSNGYRSFAKDLFL